MLFFPTQQTLKPAMRTRIQQHKLKKTLLKVQIPYQNLPVRLIKVINQVHCVENSLDFQVKMSYQNVTFQCAKEQMSEGKPLKQHCWHCRSNTISLSLHRQLFSNFWKHSFQNQTYHHLIMCLRRIWLIQWVSITPNVNCVLIAVLLQVMESAQTEAVHILTESWLTMTQKSVTSSQ